MSSPFTPDQLADLSAQIDQQLDELREELPAPPIVHKGCGRIKLRYDHVDFKVCSTRKTKTKHQLDRHELTHALQRQPKQAAHVSKQDNPEHLLVQWKAIAAVTKKEPRSFWQKFKQAARRDLCEEGGVLYAQYKRYCDLSNEAVLKSFGAVLVAMGYSGNALQVLAVALAVIVLHLGCKAICEED